MEFSAIPTIEFLKGKILLGAFDYVPEDTDTQVFLTVDDTLPYNNFHHDFGPLNISALYRFAVIFHDVLGREENKSKEVVFYSYTDSRSRANAACLLASYMILLQGWQPHQVMAPIAQCVPVMPYRDAGYSVADFIITIQDTVYGLWRAKQHGLIELREFDLNEYEKYELVENGDLNAIGKHFVAFASPVTGNPSSVPVLEYFKKYNVKMVVRLNSHLYDKQLFTSEGIKHTDLIFEDGSCPTMAFVKGFIGLAEGVIKEGGKIAVHCRAGLGRTGCLIGAHLIYTYGFTAQETIAYMRFLRPGMVVGPQQHWLYQHQNEFRDWRRTMKLGNKPDPTLAGYSPLVDLHSNASSPQISVPCTPERKILTPRNPATTNSCLPQPTPGQPRKTPSPIRVRTSSQRFTIHRDREADPTNSDQEEDDDDDVTQYYESVEPDEEADIIISNNRRVSSNHTINNQVSKPRSVSSKAPMPRVCSRPKNANSENGIMVLRQRRNITDFASQPQQLALAKQLRIASNPVPRRKGTRRDGPKPGQDSETEDEHLEPPTSPVKV